MTWHAHFRLEFTDYLFYLMHVEKCIVSYVEVLCTYVGFSIKTRRTIPRVSEAPPARPDAREPTNADTSFPSAHSFSLFSFWIFFVSPSLRPFCVLCVCCLLAAWMQSAAAAAAAPPVPPPALSTPYAPPPPPPPQYVSLNHGVVVRSYICRRRPPCPVCP